MWSALVLVLVVGGVKGARVEGVADEESDAAPFMLVIEHEDGRRCAASLVSQRTALTSAECARYVAGDVLAWAAAARASGAKRDVAARRVTRVVTSNTGALALLELEGPFPAATHVRPILMASEASECNELGRVCHAVRALPRTGRAPRLRIVDATLAQPSMCAPANMERGFCLTGPEMCPGDWGAGAVCGGKLCGVVAGAASAGCGRTLIAHNVARYRRFLHCAHVLNSCGRGDCVHECKELQLDDTTNGTETNRSVAANLTRTTTTGEGMMGNGMPGFMATIPTPAETLRPRSRPRTPFVNLPILTTTSTEAGQRTSFMWEPNRADFRSGEYGDNAAEYSADDHQPASHNVTTTTDRFQQVAGDDMEGGERPEETERPKERERPPERGPGERERFAEKGGPGERGGAGERETFIERARFGERDTTVRTSVKALSALPDYDMLVAPTRSMPRQFNLIRATGDSASIIYPKKWILLAFYFCYKLL